MKISASIIVRNEADNLVDLCESISFCDEIIIIDSDSTDATKATGSTQLTQQHERWNTYSRHLQAWRFPQIFRKRRLQSASSSGELIGGQGQQRTLLRMRAEGLVNGCFEHLWRQIILSEAYQ